MAHISPKVFSVEGRSIKPITDLPYFSSQTSLRSTSRAIFNHYCRYLEYIELAISMLLRLGLVMKCHPIESI